MIPSLRTMALDTIKTHFDTYASHPKLPLLPSSVSNELMKGVLENPEYKPTENSPTLNATVVDLADIPSTHMDAKVRWVFSTCRPRLVKLTLSRDFMYAFKTAPAAKISFEEIKNPLDAGRWLLNTFVSELSKQLPLLQHVFSELDCYTLGGAPFEKLRILRLKDREAERGLLKIDQELTEAKLEYLAKICPKVEELFLNGCENITILPKEFTKIKVLEIDNNLQVLFGGPGFTSQGLQALAKMNPDIERLFFKGNMSFTTFPKRGFPQLRSLTFIDKCPDLRNVSASCPLLKELFTPSMDSWIQLPKPCTVSNLSVLALSSKRVTEEDLDRLVKNYPALKLIILENKWYQFIEWDMPEGVLFVKVRPSFKKGLSVRFYSKRMAEDELVVYTYIANKFGQLLQNLKVTDRLNKLIKQLP